MGPLSNAGMLLATSPVDTNSAKSTQSLEDLTRTFVLSSTLNKEQTLHEVPNTVVIDPYRQRRAHQKSKTGCENCRRRRVKCSEETSCASCKRRGEQCQRVLRFNGKTPVSSMPTQTLLPGIRSTDAAVNLLHLKLFHHFQTCTVQTLLFSPEVWGHALHLSFEFEFLTNTILCVAARHLSIIQPEDATYSTAAANHLCRALSQFRHALSNDLASIPIDAFIATSSLLQHEIWTETDFFSFQENGRIAFDPLRDHIFTFFSSLKQVFLRNGPLILSQESVFMQHLQQNSLDALFEAASISHGTLAKFQDFFSHHRQLNLNLLHIPLPYVRDTDQFMTGEWVHHAAGIQNAPKTIGDVFAPIISQLCLILSFLPEAQPPNYVRVGSPLFPDLMKHITSFPLLCQGRFASMVQQSDPHALLVLYHFYRATRILLPPNVCWWSHKRAALSETALKEWLIGKINSQDNA